MADAHAHIHRPAGEHVIQTTTQELQVAMCMCGEWIDRWYYDEDDRQGWGRWRLFSWPRNKDKIEHLFSVIKGSTLTRY